MSLPSSPRPLRGAARNWAKGEHEFLGVKPPQTAPFDKYWVNKLNCVSLHEFDCTSPTDIQHVSGLDA